MNPIQAIAAAVLELLLDLQEKAHFLFRIRFESLIKPNRIRVPNGCFPLQVQTVFAGGKLQRGLQELQAKAFGPGLFLQV